MIFIAIRSNNINMLKEAIASSNWDVNEKEFGGVTPLIMATAMGLNEFIQPLIDAGANINLQEDGGLTALMIASANYDTNSVYILLNANADINIKNDNDNTAIDIATHAGLFTVVEILNQEVIYREQKDKDKKDIIKQPKINNLSTTRKYVKSRRPKP